MLGKLILNEVLVFYGIVITALGHIHEMPSVPCISTCTLLGITSAVFTIISILYETEFLLGSLG